MTRALVYIVIVFAGAVGAAWLAERPGIITIVWLDTEIRLSLAVALVLLAAMLAVLWLIGSIVSWALRSPHAVSGYFAARRRDRGYRALSRGVIAVGAGDRRLADRYAEESARLLYGEPLTVLLRAQAAQLAGDEDGARKAFQSMLADPETRLLGLHGLFMEARRLDDHVAARHFAEGAVALRPGIAWAGPALFNYQAAGGEWAAALTTLGANVANNLVEPRLAKRFEAVLRTARGAELEASEPEVALAMALEAHRLAPALVPTATLAARLLVRAGDLRKATRVLSTTWRLGPHPDLALAFSELRPGDAFRERSRRLRRLTAPNGQDVVAFTLARIAVDAKAWTEARAALAAAAAGEPTEGVCLLMAEIEEGENGDLGRTRDWLARSLRAPRDPVWMADGQVFENWAPVSPISGRVDAFEWRVPPARNLGNSAAFDAVLASDHPGPGGGSGSRTIEAAAAGEERLVVPGTAAPVAVTIAAEPIDPPAPLTAATAPAVDMPPAASGEPVPPVSSRAPAKAVVSPIQPPAPGRRQALIPPPPDDPGPTAVEEEPAEVPRLFGFAR